MPGPIDLTEDSQPEESQPLESQLSDEIESFSQPEDSQFREEVPAFLQVVAAEVALSQTFDSSCAEPEEEPQESQAASDSDDPPLRKRRLNKAGLTLGSAFRRS